MAHLKKMLNKMVSNLNRHSAWLLLQPVEWCRWYTRFQHRRVWSVCQYQCLFVLGNNDPLRTFPRKLNIKVLTQSICQCTFKNLELNLYSLLTNWRQPNKNYTWYRVLQLRWVYCLCTQYYQKLYTSSL